MLKIMESPIPSQHLRGVRLTAGQKVSRKYRKQLWKRECKNLKAIVPSVANKHVSEVEVIEQAVGYIEHLHQAIADRLGMLPSHQMVAALHHMAHLRSVAQQNAKMGPIATSPYHHGYQTVTGLQTTQLTNTALASPSKHVFKSRAPVRL